MTQTISQQSLIAEPNLDTFRRLGAQLSVETILRIYELGVPNIFSLSLDVDKLQKNERYKQAEGVIQRLRSAVYSLNGRSRPSDRFKMYASGFLYGLYTRMINDAKPGALSLEQARRFLVDLVNMQDSQGYFEGYLFSQPLKDMTDAFSSSKVYRGQMRPEDIKLLLRVYEILGTKINYALKADGLAKSLYELAREVPLDAKKELMDWLLLRDDGWNSLRVEFLKLDIETAFKDGQGIVFQGSKVEYLEKLLSNKNIVRNMQDVLKAFVAAAHKESNKVPFEDMVIMHQKIFAEFRRQHINNDLGIFRDLWLMTRRTSTMFVGDAFENTLLESIPSELRPLVEKSRRELKPIFYIIALDGIPEGKDLRDFIFGALRVRERQGSMLSDSEIIALIKNAKPERKVYDEEDISERYNALSYEDRNSIHNRWDQINPERRIENVNNDEFGLIKSLLEHYRHQIGRLLSEEDSTPEQQKEVFGQYAAPIYLQTLLVELGYGYRFKEDDVGFGSSAWHVFAGDIARKGISEEAEYAKQAEKLRPRNAVRFMRENIAFDDFMQLFDFITLLPANYEDAVDTVVRGIPPSVFRNFVLYVLFVRRALNQAGYTSDNNAIFDFKRIQVHLAGMSVAERASIMSAIAVIAPHFVHDEVMEKSNEATVAAYWRERYAKNAPKLDETAIRQEHSQENGDYDEMMYSVPGGPVAQLYVFISRLAEEEIRNIIGFSVLPLASKREFIEKYYPQSSLARDKWIKAAIQSESRGRTVEEIEKLLTMVHNRDLRDNLALGALDQYRTEHPEEFGTLGDVLQAIQRFFPEASLIRDDVLSETAQFLTKTREQYEQVRALYLDPFKKAKDLDLKETARTAMNADAFRAWTKNRSPEEKAHFLLWLMGITDEKPFFLVDFEYNFHVNADNMREDFGRRQSKYYPLAGQSSQREALEPFLYGEKGVFNDPIAMSNLLGGMFDYLIKDGPNKSVLKKVFDKVFEKADQTRREEIFLSLVWTLSLQRGEMQAGQQGVTAERQEARAVRLFLESLGLVGRQLAQVLARSLWVRPLMRDELSLVQDSARRMDKGVVFDMLEKFGLTEEFESIEEPLGSAKIAGVYRAKMRDGKIVAIKIKRPEVDKTIEADMKFFKDVFDDDLRSAFVAEGIVIPGNFVAQIEEGFRSELDFEQEAKNTAELGSRVQRTVLKKIKEFSLKKLFGDTRLGEAQGNYEFYVPQIIEVINNSAIVMEYIEGIKLSSERRVGEAGLDQKDIELAVANELLREIFYEGFYHGDPHLGNILVQKGEDGRVRIVLIDAGASFELSKNNRRLLGKLMVAVRDGQKDVLAGIVEQLGGILTGNIRTELTDQVLESKTSVGQKLLWFFHILEKNHIAMPNELLNIMRFFATGQALFDRGSSSPVTTDEAQKDFVQVDQLNSVIDQGQDIGGSSPITEGNIAESATESAAKLSERFAGQRSLIEISNGTYATIFILDAIAGIFPQGFFSMLKSLKIGTFLHTISNDEGGQFDGKESLLAVRSEFSQANNPRAFLALFFHEVGHYILSKFYGYDPEVDAAVPANGRVKLLIAAYEIIVRNAALFEGEYLPAAYGVSQSKTPRIDYQKNNVHEFFAEVTKQYLIDGRALQRHIDQQSPEVKEAYEIAISFIREALGEKSDYALHEAISGALESNTARIQQIYNLSRLTEEFRKRLEFVLGGTQHYEREGNIPQDQRPAWDTGGQRNAQIQFNSYKFMFERESGFFYEEFKTMFGDLEHLFSYYREQAGIINESSSAALDDWKRKMVSSPAKATDNLGGIDFNPNMLNIERQGQGVNFNIPVDLQAIQSIQIDGFSPVIFQIIPTNLPMLMGINKAEDTVQVSSIH